MTSIFPSTPLTLRSVFPVVSDVAPAPTFQPVAVPTAGGRWGAPGDFSFTLNPNTQAAVPTDQSIGVKVSDNQPPTQITKYYQMDVTASRVRHNYTSKLCAFGDVVVKEFHTDYLILKNIAFEFQEERPKPNIWSSNPIYKYDYDLTFLDRVARPSELDPGFPFDSGKFVMDFENDTHCAIRLKCLDENTPDTPTGDTLACKENPSTGSIPVPTFLLCGPQVSPGVPLPPMPPGVTEPPCGEPLTGFTDLDLVLFWLDVCDGC